MPSKSTRRNILQKAGLVAIAGLAGCSGDNSNSTISPSETPSGTLSPTQTASETSSPTQSETATRTETSEPAEFELVSLDFPTEISIATEFTPKITVQNIGEKTGELKANLYSRRGDSDWSDNGEWTFGEIRPGEKVTAESLEPWTLFYVENYEFALGDFSETASTTTIPYMSDWGGSYTSPDGVQMSVSSPDFKARYSRQVGERDDIVEAPDGKIFLFIQVQAENANEEAARLPHYTSWHVITGNREYEPQWDGYKDGRYEGGDVQTGIVRDGYLFYELPESVDRQNYEIVWSEEYTYGRSTAYWSNTSS